MDFKALRARFQEEDHLLKQPRLKPALPQKPKGLPPPPPGPHQAPSQFLPAGARPSLLSSINQSMDMAPRVVFKEDKKESKKPLLFTGTKKEKKKEKEKDKEKALKGSKEKLYEELADPKPKKENGKDKRFHLGAPKENTAELVPAATPPPKTGPSKKGFLGFKKAKRDSAEIPADPILDAPSSDISGTLPLIPVPLGAGAVETSAPPKALQPNIPPLPEVAPPSIPACPAFAPPPAFIPDIPAIPAPQVPTLESETPLQTETPTLPDSRPASQVEFIPDPPAMAPTPPPSHMIPDSPSPFSASSPSPPEPEVPAMEDTLEVPTPPVLEPPTIPPSPKAARPISALSALERAEDMSPARKTHPCDARIFNALEKARKKTSGHSVSSPTMTLEDPFQSPDPSLPELPPIDYEDRAKQAQVNGVDHLLEDITDEGSNAIPELLVVAPPPPKKLLPDLDLEAPASEKPDRPSSINLGELIPPPEDDAIHIPPPQFSETDHVNVPWLEDTGSDAHSPEVPTSEWDSSDYPGNPDTPNGASIPDYYSNGINRPSVEVQQDQNSPYSENKVPAPLETPPSAGQDQTLPYNSGAENVYEDIYMTKKKGKTDGGKKRKGPPKNPYAEAQPEANEEKSKTGRFGKNDKKEKAAAEGPDEKELKKKEKQRLEKEKKEQKERQEREKKEQKEREKKESEMKKKFQITGQEEAMYEATVTVTTKGRKNDLPVKNGELISIIRTTNCPKGKWLARDSSHNYGYVAVDHVELDIKEMLELGKKTANASKIISNSVDVDAMGTGNRASNHYQLSAESFTDDSEEWTGDDDEPLSPGPDSEDPQSAVAHIRTHSLPDIGNKELSINHQHSYSDISADNPNVQARHEALQKLATFFHSPKPAEPASSRTEPETVEVPVVLTDKAVPLPQASLAAEAEFDQSDMPILPPPELYADLTED